MNNVGKPIALSTSLQDVRAFGPGRQFILSAGSAGLRVSIYAAPSLTGTRFVKLCSFTSATGNQVISLPNDSSAFLKYVVDAGSIGSAVVSVMGPVSNGGSNAVALATSATDISKLGAGRVVNLAAGTDAVSIAVSVCPTSGGTYVTVGNLNATASTGRQLVLQNDDSLFMKFTVTGSPAAYDVWVTGGEKAMNYCDYVLTSLGTYTVSGQVLTVTATGALGGGTEDGITTVAAGDRVFAPEGLTHLTAADAGPWEVKTLGDTTTSAALVRPSWWQNGQNIPLTAAVKINQGTLNIGSTWKSFATTGIIGTDVSSMYPDFVAQQVTLSTGAVTVTNVPIRSATKSSIRFERTAIGGTIGILYCQSAVTAGVLGTASVTMQSQTTTGVVSAADTSTGRLVIENW